VPSQFRHCSGVPAPSPILVINCGSSSLKFAVLGPQTEGCLASGIAERLVTDGASLKMSDLEGVSHHEEMPGADHRAALLQIIKLIGHGNKLEIKAIGHRIVHGGEDFRGPVLITESVLRRIEELGDLAPLHNPAGAQGIRIATELFPDKQQVGSV
jgi:acetate kinase